MRPSRRAWLSAARIWPRSHGRRLRQRRPPRPLRHPLAGYALYRNRGDGTFEDTTARAGLDGDRDWPTSAAFADLDRDGDLDLYVCHYLKYDETNPRRCSHPDAPAKHDCNPLDFDAMPDHVFRNDAGRFVDVTGPAGLLESTGRGLGVVAADLDGDDLVDLYVANDMSANFFYRNKGGFAFEEVGVIAGAAASAEGGYKAGMGIACGDLDGDGKIDLAVTNYFGESTTFYRNLGTGMFADHSQAIGLSAPTRLLLGFGIAFVDLDNDGRLDVLSANGHVIDPRPRFPWQMPLQVLSMARRAGSSMSRRERARCSRRCISAGGWRRATSTTTGELTPWRCVKMSRPCLYTTSRAGGRLGTFWHCIWKGRSRIATVWGRR